MAQAHLPLQYCRRPHSPAVPSVRLSLCPLFCASLALLLFPSPSLQARVLQSTEDPSLSPVSPPPHQSPSLMVTHMPQRSAGAPGAVINASDPSTLDPTVSPPASSSWATAAGSALTSLAQAVGSLFLGNSASGLRSWPGVPEKTGNMQYGGGPLMTEPITVHFLLYGGWQDTDGAKRVLSAFVRSLGSDDVDNQGPSLHKWWSIATRYKNKAGEGVSSRVTIGNIVVVTHGYKKHLDDGSGGTDNGVLEALKDQITGKTLPLDGNALYAVLTGADVEVGPTGGGFCGFPSGYCGWHTQTEVLGTPLRTVFVGDSTVQCNSGCGGNGGFSETANGHYAIDSLVTVLAHEMIETATNPNTQTGYTATSQDGLTIFESGDLCNGVLEDSDNIVALGRRPTGVAQPGTGGSSINDGTYAYNLIGLEGHKFLVQTVVSLQTQSCKLQDPRANLVNPIPDASPPPFIQALPSPSPPLIQVINNPTPPLIGEVGGVADVACTAGNGSPCSSCTGPDGCACLGGLCAPLCQFSAKTGGAQPCASCGGSLCACSPTGVCDTLPVP